MERDQSTWWYKRKIWKTTKRQGLRNNSASQVSEPRSPGPLTALMPENCCAALAIMVSRSGRRYVLERSNHMALQLFLHWSSFIWWAKTLSAASSASTSRLSLPRRRWSSTKDTERCYITYWGLCLVTYLSYSYRSPPTIPYLYLACFTRAAAY